MRLFGRGGDLLLAGDQEPALGSHLVTPRRGYLHHGIYVGARKVVHYSGLAHGMRRGPVEEVSLDHFAHGQRVWVRSDSPPGFEVQEIICRARSRVGEDQYRLLTNNCEHFCEWCLRGTARSFQVEAWLARSKLSLSAAFRLIIGLRTLPSSHSDKRARWLVPRWRRSVSGAKKRATRRRCAGTNG
jgi:hypothetical protein